MMDNDVNDTIESCIQEAFATLILSVEKCPDEFYNHNVNRNATVKTSTIRKKAGEPKVIKAAKPSSSQTLNLVNTSMVTLDMSIWGSKGSHMFEFICNYANKTLLNLTSPMYNVPLSLKFDKAVRIDTALLESLESSHTNETLSSTVISNIRCLQIKNCDEILEQDFRKLVSLLPQLSIIILKKCAWVNDDVIEYMVKKVGSKISYLEFEDINITDNSLHFIGGKCDDLKTITVKHCPMIGKKGFAELKKLNIQILNIHHCSVCEDDSIDGVLSNSGQLARLSFLNCPRLTDQIAYGLFECQVSWGRKRNEKSSSLLSFEVSGNPNISHNALLYLSTSSPNIQTLDLSDCDSLNVALALKEIGNFMNIQNLKLGPSSLTYNPDNIVSSMLGHMHNITTLHLIGIDGITDQDISEILDSAIVMEELVLKDIPFGFQTVESLTSAVPNIQRLTLEGSNIFTNTHLRCVTAICLKLTQLSLKRLPEVADDAFSRCVTLKQLNSIDISYLSSNITGKFMSYIQFCPELQHIIMDGCKVSDWINMIPTLNGGLAKSLKTLSMQNCDMEDITLNELIPIFRFLPFIYKVDLTGSFTSIDIPFNLSNNNAIDGSPLENRRKGNTNPFLNFISTYSFTGLKMSDASFQQYKQYKDICYSLQRNYKARSIQKLYHKRVKWINNQKEESERFKKELRYISVCKIQSTVRMIEGKKRFQHRLINAMRVVRFFKGHAMRQFTKKALIARHHYHGYLKRKILKIFKKFTTLSQSDLLMRMRYLNPKLHRNMLLRTFSHLRDQEAVILDQKLQNGADVLWEYHAKQKIIKNWKRLIIGGSSKLFSRLCVFLSTTTVESNNSIRQYSDRLAIKRLHEKRLITLGWRALLADYQKAKNVGKLLPQAILHYDRIFKFRVVNTVFAAIVWYREFRIQKKELLFVADEHLKALYRNQIIVAFYHNKERLKFFHRNMKRARIHSMKHLMRIAFVNRIPSHVIWQKYRTAADAEVEEFISDKYTLKGYKMFFKGVIWSKVWRNLAAKGRAFYVNTGGRKHFEYWKTFVDFSKNTEVFVTRKYHEKIKKKILGVLQDQVAEKKKYLAGLQKAAGGKDGDDGDGGVSSFDNTVQQVVIFQAHIRGAMKRLWFREWSIDAQFARQKLQNFARVSLARMKMRSVYRVVNALAYKSEEREREMMLDAELESRYYEYHFSAAIDIQRCFRGWIGRHQGREIAVEYQRERAFAKLAAVEKLKEKYMVNKERANVQEVERNKAAISVQRIVRGKLARLLFTRMQNEAKKVGMAVVVQKNYRSRLAYFERLAEKRNYVRSSRHIEALRQRGRLFRYLGFRKRHLQQDLFNNLLAPLGIDPITYNYYDPVEIWEETKRDFRIVWDALVREKNIYMEHGRNQILALNARRKVLNEQGWSIKMYDSVKIVQANHKYAGQTGVVVRIDSSIPGTPLYEVKLDYQKSQTFVTMTTDALTTYTQIQPLDRVEKEPKLRGFFDRRVPEIYGMNKENPFFDGNNIDAAWVIQRAWRMHRAHNKVARVRYERWSRDISTHKEFVNALGDHNIATSQGNMMMSAFGLKADRMIHFDEIWHDLMPVSLLKKTNAVDEKTAILMEIEDKIRERLRFIETASVQGRKFFFEGFDRMTFWRKNKFFFKKIFGFGARNKIQKLGISGNIERAVITGLDQYFFSQFMGSPHVRYPKKSLYQGDWTGVPYLTQLKPHGEGVIIFLDGWGFAKEDKTLFLTIIACRYLNAADMTTSDPYCDIFCNGRNLQTSVKWKNLNPTYHESFEIDVTNPSAKLNIQVKDKDIFGGDDLLGQIAIPLSEVEDGKIHHRTELLKGEDLDVQEEFDRGEIEFRLQWKERAFEDDIALVQKQAIMAIRLQTWARRIAAKIELIKIRAEKGRLIKMLGTAAIRFQCLLRIHFAKKKLRHKKKRWRCAHRIQRRWWIMNARRELKKRYLQHGMAILIQKIIRGFLGKVRFANYEYNRNEGLRRDATCIQKYIRRKLAWSFIEKIKAEKAELGIEGGEDKVDEVDEIEEVKKVPVREWVKTYGCDPEYGLRRSRRITERIFNKVMNTKFCKIHTKPFGYVYVDSCPPTSDTGKEQEEEDGDEDTAELTEEQKLEKEKLARTNYVLCYLPSINPNIIHKEEAISLVERKPWPIILYIPTTVLLRETVMIYVLRLQCLFRQQQARKSRDFMRGISEIFAKFQRHFRRRNEIFQKAACAIQSMFHLIRAKMRTHVRRMEVNSTRSIQSTIRIWLAKMKAFNKRCVKEAKIIKASDSASLHGPEKLLDFKSNSFWINVGYKRSEIRVELAQYEKISEICIMAGCDSASARFMSMSVVTDKINKQYTSMITNFELIEKGHLWHTVKIEPTVAKYFKFIFFENYGDVEFLSLRQIRFVKCAELSATIFEQPKDCIMKDDGPMVGHKRFVTLKVGAKGWPHPTYQWYCNEQAIRGANKPELHLIVHCPLSKKRRLFRCLKCKMICASVPFNCYHVTCGNCRTPFPYKEILEYDQSLKDLLDEELIQVDDQDKLKGQIFQMNQSEDESIREQIPQVQARIDEIQQKLFRLRQKRCILKASLNHANKYSNEGVYTCLVSNVRGGSLLMKVMSDPAVVFVEYSEPYVLRVIPHYIPRARVIRKKWTTYSSVQGNFNNGILEGIVTIRYQDKSFYEGPYVPEHFIDDIGSVHPDGRINGHYGVFQCPDKTVFEGNLVDNHFDPFNLQLFYRMTRANGETYEGSFIDEEFHGVGTYMFKDGSAYEGEWHRGKRFGYGHLRDKPGRFVYEGYFDADLKHGEGMISWIDGSFYMGNWKYNQITGKGIYITPLSDVYKGQLVDGRYHGFGSILYSSGASYQGSFVDGVRNGRGVFTERLGSEYYGHFLNDRKHGEFVVKDIVPIEEIGQGNFEIKVGEYDHGTFVQWKSKFANPLATKQFIRLFDENREMFDSVYAMIVAKYLPNVPAGIDGNHEDVQRICEVISRDAGLLVGRTAMSNANSKLSKLLDPVKKKEREISKVKKRLDGLGLQVIKLDAERQELTKKYESLMVILNRETKKIEQFWFDDKTESRARFQQACKALEVIEKDEWFVFKNYRNPPIFNKKLLDAISLLLKLPLTWAPNEQMLVSDSIFNSRQNDDSALRFSYTCKLVHMMESYDVFDYADIQLNKGDIVRILSDPRFRRDSYYIEMCGSIGPLLVDWIKTNIAYVRLASTQLENRRRADAIKAEASRMKAQYNKKTDEQNTIQIEVDHYSAELKTLQLEFKDLKGAIVHAEGMIDFVKNSLKSGSLIDKRPDYYELLERQITEQQDHFEIQTKLELMKGVVDDRMVDYRKAKEAEARMNMKKYVDDGPTQVDLDEYIKQNITKHQEEAIEQGYTLGFNIEPETNTLPKEKNAALIDSIVKTIVARLNDVYNDNAFALSWTMLNGHVVNVRSFYVLCWKMWNDLAIERVENDAVTAWEDIFGTPDKCAIAAIEARVSERMSKVARKQGTIWAKLNKSDIIQAEIVLAEGFESTHASNSAEKALYFSNEATESATPQERAAAKCWIKLNPDKVQELQDQLNSDMSQEFALAMGQYVAEKAVQIMNNIADEELLHWREKAHQWRNINFDEYLMAEKKIVDENAANFEATYPEDTADNAAKVTEYASIATYINDEETKKEFNQREEDVFQAKCWSTRNQGKVRTCRAALLNSLKSTFNHNWSELKHLSEDWTKGSFHSLTTEEKRDVSLDRFYGFRNRLRSKFNFVYAYLQKLEVDMTEEIVKLEYNNPLGKKMANLRPSEALKTKRKLEDDYIAHRSNCENTLAEILSKLSTWKRYFGVKDDDGDPDQPAP